MCVCVGREREGEKARNRQREREVLLVLTCKDEKDNLDQGSHNILKKQKNRFYHIFNGHGVNDNKQTEKACFMTKLLMPQPNASSSSTRFKSRVIY